MNKLYIIFLLILSIAGCAVNFEGNYDSSKNNQQAYSYDAANCSLMYSTRNDLKNCMIAKGWYQKEQLK